MIEWNEVSGVEYLRALCMLPDVLSHFSDLKWPRVPYLLAVSQTPQVVRFLIRCLFEVLRLRPLPSGCRVPHEELEF